MAGIRQRLRDAPQQFEFFQAVRLLEELGATMQHGGRAGTASRIMFSAHPATVFPSADVAGMEETGETVRLLLSFMGLAGAVSPLPPYMSHEALGSEDSGRALRAFLDLFNSRLYELFYEAWRAQRFETSRGPDAHVSPALRIIHALAGLAPPGRNGRLWHRMAAFAGVLAGCPRSAEGLRVVLSGLLDGAAVKISQRAARWSPVESPITLGNRARLGDDAVVGTRYWDTDGLALVEIGPLCWSRYEALLPGTPERKEIEQVIAWYISRPVECKIELLLNRNEMRSARLGDLSARIGQTAMLGQMATGP